MIDDDRERVQSRALGDSTGYGSFGGHRSADHAFEPRVRVDGPYTVPNDETLFYDLVLVGEGETLITHLDEGTARELGADLLGVSIRPDGIAEVFDVDDGDLPRGPPGN
mgnify:CR=1 FL=1